MCRWCKLDPQWRCFFEDGTPGWTWKDNTEEMAAQLEASVALDLGKGYVKFASSASRNSCMTISDRFFFWKPVDWVDAATRWTFGDNVRA